MKRVILDNKKFRLTIERLCHQLIENHGDFRNACLVGVQPRGKFLSNRLEERLQQLLPDSQNLTHGIIDPTFYRDDFRRTDKLHTPKRTTIDFTIEGKNVILVDDVFFTGRTIRSALDALLDYGRPAKVELLVLIERRFTHQLPIQPDYIGKEIDSIVSEKVSVEWKETEGEDTVWIVDKE